MYRNVSYLVVVVLVAGRLRAASRPDPRRTHAVATSTPLPSPMPTPTPTSTPAPTFTPPPTPAPTLDPSVVAANIAAGAARLEAEGVEPLCLRWEDADGDGEPEWMGLYLQPGAPSQLAAFVLDGDTWYDLLPLDGEKHGLGEYPSCEMEVRDVNGDGRVEILVWGHAGTSTDLLHIFVWDGETYALLAFFEGDAGVRLENVDGDLADEVCVGYDAGDGLVWEAVHTWDGASYGWTWERYGWFYLDRPHVYRTAAPEQAVISFYLAVDDRDLPGAYGLLGPESQAAMPPRSGWSALPPPSRQRSARYTISRSGDAATVVAQVRAYDTWMVASSSRCGTSSGRLCETAAGWRLESAAADELDRWEAVYYP